MEGRKRLGGSSCAIDALDKGQPRPRGSPRGRIGCVRLGIFSTYRVALRQVCDRSLNWEGAVTGLAALCSILPGLELLF